LNTRAERVSHDLREQEFDALLVSAPTNVRYLTGYTGSNGLALIAADEDVSDRFFTDFRYASASAQQIPEEFEREIISSGDLFKAAAQTLSDRGSGARGRLAFEEDHLTVAQHARLAELIGEGWELVGCADVVERLRAVKDAGEIDRIRAGTELAEEALRRVLERGLVGRTERAVAVDLEFEMRRLGADGPSFPSIVASGAHGALPHAEPRDESIARDVLVTIDWGAYLDGYCSDCTRTYATGAVGEQAIAVYELVLRAQEAALASVRAGIGARELDAVARAIIEEAGYGEHFGHGLGHGVGMEIHEGPRLSRTASEQPLQVGNIVTVEPGVYLPGDCGVRIEDLLVVLEDDHETLTRLPKELTAVS
jgi:Xaa-Pro aminopeptidase